MNRMMTSHRDESPASKMPKEMAKKQTLYKRLTDGEEAFMVDGEKVARPRVGSANFDQVFITENMAFAFIDGSDHNLIYNMYLNNPDVGSVKQMLRENLPEHWKNQGQDFPKETDFDIKEQQSEVLRNAKKRGSVRDVTQIRSNFGPQEPFMYPIATATPDFKFPDPEPKDEGHSIEDALEQEISIESTYKDANQDEKPSLGKSKPNSVSDNVKVSMVSMGDSEKLQRARANNVNLAA